MLIKLKSARHCCWHRNFQLSSSIFHDTFEFFIIRFNEEIPRNLQALSSFGFSFAELLFPFAFRCIRHMFPHIWPNIVWS